MGRLPRIRPFRVIALCLLCTAPAVAAAPGADDHVARPVESAAHESSLIARWTFEQSSSPTIPDDAGRGHDIVSQDTAQPMSAPGPFGNALRLTGQHRLAIPSGPMLESLPQISFSVWAMPTDLSDYREIFRKEDGDDRVLFSFQNNGTILSLGLNIGGYVECDGQIDPTQVLDGLWHHCAATFDGHTMRVYLDGQPVGALERAGAVTVRAGQPAFVGSMAGSSEYFQGALDDLRIYRQALTPDDIAQLYRAGASALSQHLEQIQQQLPQLYTRSASFAETIAACRRSIVARSEPLPPELLAAVQTRLRADFPDDYRNLSAWLGTTPAEYLTLHDPQLPRRLATRLLELVVEYRPLTDEQWARQTPQQRQHWSEIAQFERTFQELLARDAGDGDDGGSADWVRLILQLGPRIEWRPATHEAVAPYVTPSTPATQDLSQTEASDALQRDWLHQVDGNPTPQQIAQEIAWTRQLADRIRAQYPDRADFSHELAELSQLEQQVAAIVAADRELYFAVRRIKRNIMLSNPVVDFRQVLLVDMPFPAGSEWPHETRHRLGYMAVPGGRLLILDGLGPDGHLRQLAPQAPLHGSFWRPDLSYDATQVLFCFKPHNEKSFHLYQVNIDGSGLVQLTDGPFDDLDPVYLPDGQHVVFSTTRGHTYVRCMPPTNAYVLARCDRDGQNIYLISHNNEPDYLPSVMNDGRIIYTRWEYTDKPLWRAQSLWTVNPDGTQASTFWGNQSVWPDLLKDARSIPFSRRIMFTGSAHHNWFSGSVGIIDPEQGMNFPFGLTKITAELPWPESGNGPVDPIESPRYHTSGCYEAYYSPYPLSEQDFLVSASRGGKFVLYLMDVDGNRELIYEAAHHILHAQPLRPRPVPPVLADNVIWPTAEQRLRPEDGIIFSANVYDGASPELREKASFLQILNIDPKTYTYWYKRPYISTGPVVSAVQSDGVKRVLGTVPIEADGSVAFYAPAGMALHFQLLDENYRALQTMRSFVGVMPGEYRGCLGCHESHSTTPQPGSQAIALTRQPSHITPPPWGDDTVSYVRYVQPVLDQYCGDCHQGQGEARQVLDLTYRPGVGEFAEPYLTLIGRPTWGQPYVAPAQPTPGWGIADTIMVEAYDTVDPAAYRTPAPMTKLSYRSRLIELCSNGKHYGVQVDQVNLRRLMAWVDTMCPFRGREEICEMPDPQFQGVEWLSVRPKLQTAPQIIRPGPIP